MAISSINLLAIFLLKGLRGDADWNRDRAIELKDLFDYLKPKVEGPLGRNSPRSSAPQLLGNPSIVHGIRLVERVGP
jgi:hypothetical protein